MLSSKDNQDSLMDVGCRIDNSQKKWQKMLKYDRDDVGFWSMILWCG